MEKTITIDGKEILFKATASTPRRYRQKFQKDFFTDISALLKAVGDEIPLSATLLESFENVAYIMAKQADDTISESPDEWLDNFEMMSIYDVLPELIALWMNSEETLSESKKKHD